MAYPIPMQLLMCSATTLLPSWIALAEGVGPHPLRRLDHALYLGRELQKAERCLIEGSDYVQD